MRATLLRSAVAAWLATAAAAQKDLAETAAVQLEPGWAATEAMLVDVDGDSLDDLVLLVHEAGVDYRRELRVHRGRSPFGYAAMADTRLAMPFDVVAFAAADVHEAPGTEIVLFGGRRAVTWRPLAPQKEAFEELVSGDVLWQVPDPETVLPWESGVSDLDGDGLADLVMPVSGGYRVRFQRRDAAGAVFEEGADLALPRGTAVEQSGLEPQRGRMSVDISVGEEKPAWLKGPFLSVQESVPAPWAADWDGDGDRDLLALTADHLLVWVQDPPRRFTTEPTLVLELPVVGDLKRRLDVTFGAHVADIDRDGRADCILLAGDYRTDNVRTQVLVYVQDPRRSTEPPLFGAKGIPRQLLVLSGFAGGTQLTDVNGDGAPDLVVGSLRTDLVDTIGAAMSERLEAELYVYLNRKGMMSKRPDLVHSVVLQAGELVTAAGSLTARFFGDITGDGVNDLLLRTDPKQVQVRMVRRRGDGLEVVRQPVWQRAVHEEARLIPLRRGERAPELLVVEPSQVIHVRFR